MKAGKKDVYEQVTDRLVAKIEAGVNPFACPWVHGPARRPLRVTGEPYRGVNTLLLWLTAWEKGFDAQHWMTYRQAQELGAQVKTGEKATVVVYYNTYEKASATVDEDGERATERIPFARAYWVFNCAQIDGLPDKFKPEPVELPAPFERLEKAWEFYRNTGATFDETGARAFYSRSLDRIVLPPQERFRDALAHASVAGHELIHWTGAPNRLDRVKGKKFADKAYGFEELIAEIGASFLCADLDLVKEPRDESATYLDSWLKIIKADKRAVFTAASAAEKAVGYLHSLQPAAQEAVAV